MDLFKVFLWSSNWKLKKKLWNFWNILFTNNLGHIRIRAKSQGMAISLGDKINESQKKTWILKFEILKKFLPGRAIL